MYLCPMQTDSSTDHTPSVRVWDLPTRLFHWFLVICVVALVVTGNMGGDMMVWHARFGFAVLALVLFRLGWGFWGGHWSRFKQFDLHPKSALTYVREIQKGSHQSRFTEHHFSRPEKDTCNDSDCIWSKPKGRTRTTWPQEYFNHTGPLRTRYRTGAY